MARQVTGADFKAIGAESHDTDPMGGGTWRVYASDPYDHPTDKEKRGWYGEVQCQGEGLRLLLWESRGDTDRYRSLGEHLHRLPDDLRDRYPANGEWSEDEAGDRLRRAFDDEAWRCAARPVYDRLRERRDECLAAWEGKRGKPKEISRFVRATTALAVVESLPRDLSKSERMVRAWMSGHDAADVAARASTSECLCLYLAAGRDDLVKAAGWDPKSGWERLDDHQRHLVKVGRDPDAPLHKAPLDPTIPAETSVPSDLAPMLRPKRSAPAAQPPAVRSAPAPISGGVRTVRYEPQEPKKGKFLQVRIDDDLKGRFEQRCGHVPMSAVVRLLIEAYADGRLDLPDDGQ